MEASGSGFRTSDLRLNPKPASALGLGAAGS